MQPRKLYASNDFDLCRVALDFAERLPVIAASQGNVNAVALIAEASKILQWLRSNCDQETTDVEPATKGTDNV